MGSGQSKGRSQMGGSGEDDEESSQWSRLPPELMQSIYGKVADVGDHIRLRAVSTAWRSAAVMQIHHQHPPWLMLPYSQYSATRSFLSLANNSVSTLRLPEMRGKLICGSSYGWFVLLHAKTASVSLLNPVAGSQIRLPPATHFPRAVGIRGRRRRFCGIEFYDIYNEASGRFLGATHDARDLYIQSAVLSSNPGSPDCIVIATFPAGPKVAFCRPGSDEWTILDTTLGYVAAVAYHGGKFYAIDHKGNCAICDGSRPPFNATLVPSMKVPAGFHECNMVKPSGSAELLLVAVSRSDAAGRQNIYCNVYRLDQSGGQAIRWSRASSIGDHALFFSEAHCSCVPARGTAGCMADCVYYVFPRRGYATRPSTVHRGQYERYAKHHNAGYEILRSKIHHVLESPAMPVNDCKQISRDGNKPWGGRTPLWI